MSWSVNAKGTVAEAKEQLAQGFSYPLADQPAGLADEGERETVRRVRDMILQCLDTFDPARTVTVSAYGHMGFSSYEAKEGAYQQVNISIGT
jgi:hypothetical protein